MKKYVLATASVIIQVFTVTLLSLLLLKVFSVESASESSDQALANLIAQNKAMIEEQQKIISILNEELAKEKYKPNAK